MAFCENSPSFANLNGKACLPQSGVYNIKHKARDDGRTSLKEILTARKWVQVQRILVPCSEHTTFQAAGIQEFLKPQYLFVNSWIVALRNLK